jgi:predicted nucleotidyltransferase
MTDIAFFGSSGVRRAILRTFFARPGVVRHVRELARELGRSATIVSQELDRLERAGILTSERIGRTRRYRVDDTSPIATEVRSLVQKTIGIEARVREAIVDLPGVEEAFLYGSYAAGTERATSDLDLFVVGAVDQEQLTERLTDVERELGRDVNVSVYERAEIERLRANGDRFVATVLDGPRVPLIKGRA